MAQTLIDMYKNKMKSVIMTTYNGQINEKFVDNYLENIVSPVRNKKIIANVRNLYKYIYHAQIEINDVLEDVEDENLNILSNGLFTTNEKPVNYFIIDEQMANRAHYKKLMLKAKENNDDDNFIYYNNMQNKVKADTNSIYGAATMPRGFISNVDMGSAITAQARNFISEMVWNIERFLGGNYTFEDIDEIYSWFDELFKIKASLDYDKSLDSYISYIPTADDCRKKFIYSTRDVIGIRKDIKEMNRTNFMFFEMMPDWKRIFYYYSYNPLELIQKNRKIAEIMYKIINSKYKYINPYVFDKLSEHATFDEVKEHFIKQEYSAEDAANIAEFFMDLSIIRKLMKVFCFATICISNRVVKYENRKRKVCVIGDTDSTMPSFYEIVYETLKMFNMEDAFENNDIQIRLTMAYVTIVSDLMSEACLTFVKNCNQYNPDDTFYMFMKNEFFFPIVLLYNVKKNYIGIQTIQEGKMLPPEKQLAITGRSLGSSGLNEYVSGEILKIISEEVLRSKEYNPLTVYKRVMDIRKHIAEEIRNGDFTFGVYATYNGADNIKDPETTSNVRAALIWNELYPEDYISPGDKIYVFDTSLVSESDLDRIPDNTEENIEIKRRLREVVFKPHGKYDFSRFGCKSFAMPAYGDTRKIPDWILPFIIVDNLCEKHLQPVIALFPSLLLSPASYVNAGSSTKKLGVSSLIQF